MHPLPQAIKALFTDIPSARLRELLVQDGHGFGLISTDPTDGRLFDDALIREFPHQINEMRGNIATYIRQIAGEGDDLALPGSGLDPFRLLYRFAQIHLRDQVPHPHVKFERFFSWRYAALPLGEELSVIAFLAAKDRIQSRDRKNFTWPPFLPTDNVRLRQLFTRGLAENHYHLWGSGPHFHLSWINLMNHPVGRFPDFAQAGMDQKNLNPDSFHHPRYPPIPLYTETKLAALIRMWLWMQLSPDMEPSSNALWEDIQPFLGHSGFALGYNETVEARLYELRRHAFPLQGRTVLDYTIPRHIHRVNWNDNLPFYGERFLTYKCLQQIYFGPQEHSNRLRNALHLYLRIKERFRAELIQVNGRSGFDNFKQYQDRKTEFLPDRGIWSEVYSRMCHSLNLQNPNLHSLEARLKPKNSALSNQNVITGLDRIVRRFSWRPDQLERHGELLETWGNDREGIIPDPVGQDQPGPQSARHFYVAHFIKSQKRGKYEPRNSNARLGAELGSKAIFDLREQGHSAANRLLGIDAAGSEMTSRPEVYAQTFRYLKGHVPSERHFTPLRLQGQPLPRLGATFHAGEDFLDLVDGLRIIDEAILFLQLCRGDRLGHALALGQEPGQYYKYRSFRIYLPRQELLDNIAWLLEQIREIEMPGKPSLVSVLQKRFFEEYDYVFGSVPFSTGNVIHHYFKAWRLRGDNPEVYRNGQYEPITAFSNWQAHQIDPLPQLTFYRNIPTVTRLLEAYFWDPNVEKRGREVVEFKIDTPYIKAISFIQNKMMRAIAQKGIAIETNPTSNFLIGAFRRYDRHPIFRFHNRGLEKDPAKLRDCPQLFVSINTDDIGVFSTNLESEFALMALALEKMEDDDGQPLYQPEEIYQYLESIRRMGFEMSFRA